MTPLQVVAWWELRRPLFNVLVGAAGVLSSILVVSIALVGERYAGEPIGLPDPPGFALVGVAAYALAANLFFTGGWIVELIVRRVWPAEADSIATVSFSLGLLGSVILTLSFGGLLALLSAVEITASVLGHRGP